MSAQVIPFSVRRVERRGRIPSLAMLRPRPTAVTVLNYIDRWRRYAAMQRDRDAEQHYADLWREVFEITHGKLPPRAIPQPRLSQVDTSAVRLIPITRQQMLKRPVRKVVATASVLRRGDSSAGSYSVDALTLECGHVIEELPFHSDGKPPQRRRCKECCA